MDRLRTISVVLAVALTAGICKAQEIRIARFKDNKDCAISYTFDDGLKEHYTLVTPVFKKLGFKATFVVNAVWMDRNTPQVVDTGRMTWTDLKEMATYGNEISNHGYEHKNHGKFSSLVIKEDISKNDSAIYSRIGIMPRTFAYPNNTKTVEGVKLASEGRVGTRTFQRSLGGKSKPEELQRWVDTLIARHDWGVTMTHGITYGYDHFANPQILWDHLQLVKQHEDRIWVGTFHDVSTYTRERDSTTLRIDKKDAMHYTLIPQCVLDKTLFNVPLTIVVHSPNVQRVRVRQGMHTIRTNKLDGKTMFDIDPFGGPVTVQMSGKE